MLRWIYYNYSTEHCPFIPTGNWFGFFPVQYKGTVQFGTLQFSTKHSQCSTVK